MVSKSEQSVGGWANDKEIALCTTISIKYYYLFPSSTEIVPVLLTSPPSLVPNSHHRNRCVHCCRLENKSSCLSMHRKNIDYVNLTQFLHLFLPRPPRVQQIFRRQRLQNYVQRVRSDAILLLRYGFVWLNVHCE